MAKGETLSGLYLRIGLNYDELNQDFVRVEETLQANIARLNRREQLINLKAKIDLSTATSSTEQLRIQQQKLQQIIEVTQERLKLYRAELQGTEQAFGATNKLTEQARIQVSKYELALARLTEELKKLEKHQQNAGGNKLLEGYQNLKMDAAEKLSTLANAWSSLGNSSTSAGVALEAVLGIIGKIPLPAGIAVASIAAIPIATKAAENALLSLAEPAMKAGDALYVMGRGMQMNMEDTMKLATICKITGIEISEVAATLKRFNTRIMAATSVDDPRLKMLERYGAKIRDVNGHLKNNIEMSAELGKALKKAQAEGNGIAFRDVIFARYVSGDFITYLEDFADNYEASKKIVKNKLADPTLAHAVQGNMNTLNTQIDELKGVASMALLPASNEVISRLTEQFGKLTEVIAENKDGIMAFGSAVATVINSVGDITTEVTSKIIKFVSAFSELFVLQDKNLNKRYVEDADKLTIAGKIPEELQNLTTIDDFVNKELQRNYTYTERRSIESNPALYQLARSHYQSQFDALMKKREQLKQEADLYIIIRNLQNENIKNAKDLMNQELKANFPAEEVQNINLDPAKFEQTLDRYKRAFQKLDIVRKYLDDDTIKSPEDLLQSAFSSKLAGLKEDSKEYQELLKISEEIFAAFDKIKTAKNPPRFKEKEELKPLQLEAIKKQLAEERALTDELYKITHSDFEGKKLDLLKQRGDILNDETKSAIQKATAEKIYQIKSEKLEQEQADKIQKIRDSVNAEFQSDIEKRIASIEKEKQTWIDAGMEEAEAETLAQRKKNAAIAALEEEFTNAISALHNTALENRLAQIEKEKQAWIDKGVAEVKATEWSEQAKADAQRDAAMSVLKSQLKEFHAFQAGGFEGLRQYQLKQLIKSGISAEDLQMTPKMLEEFQKVQQAVQKSLLSNFMIAEDKNFVNAVQGFSLAQNQRRQWQEYEELSRGITVNGQSLSKANLGQLFGLIPKAELEKMPQSIADVNAQLALLDTSLQGITSADVENLLMPTVEAETLVLREKNAAIAELEEEFTNAIGALHNTALENRLAQIEKEKQAWIDKGVAEVKATEWSEQAKADAQRDAAMSVLKSQLKEFHAFQAGGFEGLRQYQLKQLIKSGISAEDLQMTPKMLEEFQKVQQAVQKSLLPNFMIAEDKNFVNTVQSLQLSKVTGLLGNFGQTLQQSTPAPPNITVTVQIDEAHAWDSQHISELADKVADKITPALTSAIGGSSNSY